MKVSVLVNSNPENKTGYFNATHQRIKNLAKHCDVNVFVVKKYDSKILSFVKKIIGKKPFYRRNMPFDFDSIHYSELWLQHNLLSEIMLKLNRPIMAFNRIVNISSIPTTLAESDIISAQWGYPQGFIATVLSKKLDKKSAVTYHGSDIHSILDSSNKHMLQCTQFTLDNAGVNIFVSKGLEEFAIKHICNKQINTAVIYNTIDTTIFSQKASENKSDTKIVGFVGNLKLVKRADKLPEIFNRIHTLNPKVSFIVVGDGMLRDVIEQACIDHKLPVTFTGMVNPSEIPQIMQKFDLLTLPSRDEGLGLVLIEALAMGVKAIGTDVGGIKEVLGNEYVVAEGDEFEERFAQKALDVLENTKIQKLDKKFINDVSESEELLLYRHLSHKK